MTEGLLPAQPLPDYPPHSAWQSCPMLSAACHTACTHARLCETTRHSALYIQEAVKPSSLAQPRFCGYEGLHVIRLSSHHKKIKSTIMPLKYSGSLATGTARQITIDLYEFRIKALCQYSLLPFSQMGREAHLKEAV